VCLSVCVFSCSIEEWRQDENHSVDHMTWVTEFSQSYGRGLAVGRFSIGLGQVGEGGVLYIYIFS
jgi:hypothetical protein